jgi:hypothetical protein
MYADAYIFSFILDFIYEKDVRFFRLLGTNCLLLMIQVSEQTLYFLLKIESK